MYSILEINGERFEIAANALTKHFYKQVFRTDLKRDLMKNNPGLLLKKAQELRKLAAELKDGTVDNYEEKLETSLQLEELQDTTARLGFIMNIQATKQFGEYWGKTSMTHFAEHSAVRRGNSLDCPHRVVRVKLDISRRISFQISVLRQNLTVFGKLFNKLITCSESAFAV